MGAGWAHADHMTETRRNREWIARFLLGLPIFDVDNDDAVTVDVKAVDGADVSTSPRIHWTAGAGIDFALVDHVVLVNNDSGTHQVSVYLVGSGGAANLSTLIWAGNVYAGERVRVPGPWIVGASATIVSVSTTASAANKVGLTADVTEFTGIPAGHNFPVDNGTEVTTSLVAMYTCPASGVRHAQAFVTVCNSSTSSVVTTVERRPSGGSQSDSQNVFNGRLLARETRVISIGVLEPGDAILLKAASTSTVSGRATVVEFLS